MVSSLKEHLYTYAVAYLKVYGESAPGDIVDSFMRTFPDECKRMNLHAVRTKLSSAVTMELKWSREDADIQRTGNRTLRLKEGHRYGIADSTD